MSTTLSRETFRMAGQVLLRNPGRSTLTVLGLAIGVGAFIAMVSFGEGARKSVLSQFESLGTNIVKVKSRVRRGDTGVRPSLPLTDADVAAIRREATTVDVVVPLAFRYVMAASGGEQVRTEVYGSSEQFADLRHWPVTEGGFFDALDMSQRAKVVVLGSTVAGELFGDGDPLGKTVTLKGTLPCRVIGVLESKGRSIGGGDLDDIVVIPATTYLTYVERTEGYINIDIRPLPGVTLSAVKDEVGTILRRTRNIPEDQPADFDLASPDDVTRAADQTSKILTGLLAGIAAVSLLVGGIGIMNILLVSVAERTHEIGIRAAIGASPRQILVQFLSEALALAVVGSAAGAGLGTLTAALVAAPMGWPRAISPEVVLGSCAFGIAVGVVFGYIPAQRAAKLDPIAALRRE